MGKAEKGLNFFACLLGSANGIAGWVHSIWNKEARKVCTGTPRGCSLCRPDSKSGWRNGSSTLENDFYLFWLGLKPLLGYRQKGDNGKTQQTRKTSTL